MTIKQLSIKAKPLTQEDFYKATGAKPLDPKECEFIAGYICEGRAFQSFRMLEDGLLVLAELGTNSYDALWGGPFRPLKFTAEGFLVVDFAQEGLGWEREGFAERGVVITTAHFQF
jgi:hypothetical protein